jgi:uncharacterized metal-binding protein
LKCHNCSSPDCYRKGKKCSDLKELLKDLPEFEKRLLKVASEVEKEFYCKLTRVEETVEFAKRMGFRKIGIAFCIGLFEEVKVLSKIFESWGFRVFSVACKVGAIDKTELNIEKINPQQFEASCNPVGQAKILNKVGTDMNIIVGLCVGHDMLFQMHSKVPTTTLIVKDRVLAHNPIGALYSNYYKRKLVK